MLSDLFRTVSHFKLESLIDLLEVLELERVTDRCVGISPQDVLGLNLIVVCQIRHAMLSTDLGQLQVDPDDIDLLE